MRSRISSRRSPLLVALVVALVALFAAERVDAQENPSGGLDFGVAYQRSTSERNAVALSARAMATDRFPGTVVGRFAELAGHIGVDFQGEILTWMLRFELGVGVATDYFVLFVASGIVGDAYQSIDEASGKESVEPGAGIPVTLGLWVRATDWLYFYGMMEPSFVILVEEREVSEFEPFGFGEEFRIRGGFGFTVQDLHTRFDYTWHDVAPVGWHSFTLGFGPKAEVIPGY